MDMTKTILHIETTTDVCSLAVSNGGKMLLHRVDDKGHNHARMLPLFVEEALRFVEDSGLKLDAVALSKGPGSYTGLRIGASMAKGICYAQNIPLVAVDTLALMCVAALQFAREAGCDMLCPMIDARRMEVYDGLYDMNLNPVLPVQAHVITEDAFSQELLEHRIAFFGNGSAKCADVIGGVNAVFLPGVVPDASAAVGLAELLLQDGKVEDVAYFEPYYLKEFQATVSKNKILG